MEKSIKLESSWEELKEKIKETNPEITDEDLTFVEGREEELLEKLALKLHKNKEDIKGWIESVSANKSIAG
jgi:uncharacterized protein YjbJ (UPF0337 family)